MKKLLIALAVVSLTGCATIQQSTLYKAWNMAKFDNNEYSQINSIRTQANLGAAKCGTAEVVPVVDNLYYKSVELRNYSASIPHNEEAVKMTGELAEIIKGLNERYHGKEAVSPSYCTLKFGTIEKNAVTIQNVIGAKPR
jgi:uncharacterized protein YceK